MRTVGSIFLLLVVALIAIAGDKPRVSRASLVAMEKSLDDRVTRFWGENPFALLGPTRGIYLEGYGAVFTAEVNLANSPITLMHLSLTKQELEEHHQKKLERVPKLKGILRQALADSAASLDGVSPEEQIVIAVFLARYPWEDTAGIPGQITMQAQKKKLLDAKRAGGAGLEAAIRITEY